MNGAETNLADRKAAKELSKVKDVHGQNGVATRKITAKSRLVIAILLSFGGWR